MTGCCVRGPVPVSPGVVVVVAGWVVVVAPDEPVVVGVPGELDWVEFGLTVLPLVVGVVVPVVVAVASGDDDDGDAVESLLVESDPPGRGRVVVDDCAARSVESESSRSPGLVIAKASPASRTTRAANRRRGALRFSGVTLRSRRRGERERVTGVEPASPAWKAGALPLSYTREIG